MVKKIIANSNNVKTEILSIIKNAIEESCCTQQEAANVLELDQPKVSSIKNLKTKGFSLERMFMLLSKLDYDVEITVRKITKPNLS
ncbi:helix-turn-helix domain-containing protein [Wolbachia endosymbiont of Folsomia candida]|uniref:helix-turn-helix domain-containing protein n=1 Tax=Wolbachia endosymbiont of Folsomia candida TaxID=169402 RepID=UPI000B247989|nr:XRE family transcriptional regulator [Wolbachia endosymbiont of Folsomia candida]APR98597.1 XRE family transcriptional regulator [Wolbachia endosymbiont of Folsomia candida]